MEKHCKIKFNENSIVISGICEDSITIDISGDMDVTSLVEKLIQLIDTEDSIVLDTQENTSWNDKNKMIYNLVSKIFEKYNACLTENNNEKELIQDYELEQDRNINSNNSMTPDVNTEDLPF